MAYHTSPPKLQLAQMDGATLARIAPYARLPETGYLHWDELRHRTPPGSLTTLEWWSAQKLARLAARRELAPLLDKDDQPFWCVLTDDILRRLDLISRRASGEISIDEVVVNPETRERYVVNSLMEEAITSSQLEGAHTTRQVAREMLKNDRKPRDKSELMIVNNYIAMQHLAEFRQEPLTPDLIMELHRILTDGTLIDPDDAGRIQTDQTKRVHVGTFDGEVLHVPPPVQELPQRMQRLCNFANDDGSSGYVPSVLRALALHFMVGYDHYFVDGNGRVARALFYWSMLRNGFWLTEFLSISRILRNAPARYQRSFEYTETDESDLTYFFDYHLEVIVRAIDELHAYLAARSLATRKARTRLGGLSLRLNHRQQALLLHALRHPGFHYTSKSHARSHGITRPTANYDLGDLTDLGLLTRKTIGRTFTWSPIPNLEELITELSEDFTQIDPPND